MFKPRKLQAPKAGSCDCPRVSGERCKLSQWGLGRSPRNRRDFEEFSCKMEYILGSYLIFCNNQIKKSRLNLLGNYTKSARTLYFVFRSVVVRVVVIGALGAEGHRFDFTSSRHIMTLRKSFTRNCLYDVMRRS